MNPALLDQLFNEDESACLDFKAAQYPFAQASDEQKGELLKDILAFANAWRRVDAYIVIGVADPKGSTRTVVGTDDHPDEASLQQFVNAKTNRPVAFSYETCNWRGVVVGVFRIPCQRRPVFLRSDYGRLTKNTVYIRRGSSTATADPAEIAEMGADDAGVAPDQPSFKVQFADVPNRRELGTTLMLISRYRDPPKRLPEYRSDDDSSWGYSSDLLMLNREYWREKALYLVARGFFHPITLVVHNTSGVVATDVRITITGDDTEGIRVLEKREWLQRPAKSRLEEIRPFWNRQDEEVQIIRHGNQWTAVMRFDKIQPRSVVWGPVGLFVGARESVDKVWMVRLTADELRDPVDVPLTLRVQAETLEPLTFDEIRNESDEDED